MNCPNCNVEMRDMGEWPVQNDNAAVIHKDGTVTLEAVHRHMNRFHCKACDYYPMAELEPAA